MKKYTIKEDITLSFIDDNEQKDIITNDGIIECDGKTIWYTNECGRFESISSVTLIDFWCNDYKIKSI